MLPNVKINITEEIKADASSLNSFLPLVILKTKTGPINTAVLVKSQNAFDDLFGTADETVPSAFGLYQYLLNGPAYVVRVAGSTAAEGTASILSGEGASTVDLIDITTTYKTDDLNGLDVSLINDTSANKLYLSFSKDGNVITSIKETLNYSTATADELEEALDKIVNSFNEAQSYLVLENKFTNKTSEDDKPDSFTSLVGSITGGVSGTATDAEVCTVIEKFRGSDLGIDAILAPEYESKTVIDKLASVAGDSSFMALASITGSTTSTITNVANTLIPNPSLALYADKVRYAINTNIAVPACIGILPAYINKNLSSKWLAPAGVTRATLTQIAALDNEFGDPDLEILYTNDIPVNGIKRIVGRGFVVWGQKTTEQDDTQYQDRINVVRLCKYLTKEIYKISYDYLFEPITNYTYNAWTLRVEAILEGVKNGSGLSEYRVIMDDTINTDETKAQNKLLGIVRFKPLEAAEFIEIDFIVTDNVNGGAE